MRSPIKFAVRAPWLKRTSLITTADKQLRDSDIAWSNGYIQLGRNAADTGDVELIGVNPDNKPQIGAQGVDPTTSQVTFNLTTNGSLGDQLIFVATRAMTILKIEEVHKTAGGDAGAVTLNITKETGAQAPAAGSSVMSGTFNMKGTAETLQQATLSTDKSLLELAAGDRLSANFTGVLTSLAGVVVTIVFSPSGRGIDVVYRMDANGDLVDQTFFTATRPCVVSAVREVHKTLGTDAGAVTFQITKDVTTDVPGAGTDILTTALSLKTVINTSQSGVLVAAAATLTLAPGDRLSIDFAGTLTAVAGVVVVVTLNPIFEYQFVQFTLSKNANLGVDQQFFIADRDYFVDDVNQVHSVAAGAVAGVEVTIDRTTTGAGAGTPVHTDTNGFDLNATANTVQWGVMGATRNRYLYRGDRLGLDFTGTITATAGVTITVGLIPR